MGPHPSRVLTLLLLFNQNLISSKDLRPSAHPTSSTPGLQSANWLRLQLKAAEERQLTVTSPSRATPSQNKPDSEQGQERY